MSKKKAPKMKVVLTMVATEGTTKTHRIRRELLASSDDWELIKKDIDVVFKLLRDGVHKPNVNYKR